MGIGPGADRRARVLGGGLAAASSNNYGKRTYPGVDAADEVSCRPDFALADLPGLPGRQGQQARARGLPVSKDTPKTFIAT